MDESANKYEREKTKKTLRTREGWGAQMEDIDVNEKEFVSELLINFGYDPTLRNHVRQAAKPPGRHHVVWLE